MRAALSDKPDPASLSFVRLAANPVYNAQLRTTCVATMLEGGHAVNALPQLATAKVNCRIMPGEPIEGVKATLEKVLDDDQIKVTQMEQAVLSAPSALHEEIMGAIGKLSKEFWPTAVILPTHERGAQPTAAICAMRVFRPTAIPVSPATSTTSAPTARTSASP